MQDEDGTDDEDTSLSDLASRVSGDAPADTSPSTEDDGASETDSEWTPSLSDLATSVEGQSDPDSEPDAADDPDEWDLVSQDPETGGAALDPKTEAVLELAGDAANVLLLGPVGCPADESLCSRLMAARPDAPVSVLVITVSETPSQRLSVLQSYLETPVERTAVVDVRNYDRDTNYDQYEGPVDIRTVSNPEDLRRIGIVTSRILSEWEEHPGATTVCFHSLSDLLSLIDDRPQLFRFLHVLQGRIQSAGARAHYHLDPSQHDEESVRTFESLFDTVLAFEDDGSVSLL